jgi:hypothetical protein
MRFKRDATLTKPGVLTSQTIWHQATTAVIFQVSSLIRASVCARKCLANGFGFFGEAFGQTWVPKGLPRRHSIKQRKTILNLIAVCLS